MRCRIAEDEQPASALREAARDARGAPARRRRSGASSSRASRTCSASASTSPTTGRTCSPPGGSSSSGSPTCTRPCSRSRTCNGPTRRCSTSSSTCSSGRGTHPLYVVTLARPELLERRPTWGAGHRNFTSLYLEPLSQPAMEELLTGLVPGLPASLRERRSSPAPRASRCTRSRRCGCCSTAARSSRRARSTGPSATIESLEVPETLHALIAARLDGLSAGGAACSCRTASVLGKTFTRAALAALTGFQERRARRAARTRSSARRCSSLQSDPRSPEHGQYGFLQDLVRHVAYETLSRRERQRPSPRCGRAPLGGADRGGGDGGRRVAPRRRLRARPRGGRRAGDQASGPSSRSSRAGERAASLAAAAEAQRYFERAAELTDEPLEQAALEYSAGRMALRAGRLDEARALLERAQAVFAAEGAMRQAARRLGAAGRDRLPGSRPSEAVARLEAALGQLAGDGARRRLCHRRGAARSLPRPQRHSTSGRLPISSRRSSWPRRSVSTRCSPRR